MRADHSHIPSRRATAWAIAIAAVAFDASFVHARLTRGRVGLEVNATATTAPHRLATGVVIAGVNNLALAVVVLFVRRLVRRLPEGRRRFDAPTLTLAALLVPAIPVACMTT